MTKTNEAECSDSEPQYADNDDASPAWCDDSGRDYYDASAGGYGSGGNGEGESDVGSAEGAGVLYADGDSAALSSSLAEEARLTPRVEPAKPKVCHHHHHSGGSGNGSGKKKKNKQPAVIARLMDMAVAAVAEHFNSATMLPHLAPELLEMVQKRMPREIQIAQLGVYKEWHANGRLRKLQHYKDGKEHGVCLKWWPNGKLWHKKECASGQLQGHRQLWYKSGQMKWYARYKEGSQVHGECKWWHSNGQLRSEAHYKNDKLHGEYKFWNKSGGLWSEGVYLWGHRFENSSTWTSVAMYPARLLGQM